MAARLLQVELAVADSGPQVDFPSAASQSWKSRREATLHEYFSPPLL